jgi:hypothetical protein
MNANRDGTGGGSSNRGDRSKGMSAPSRGTSGRQGDELKSRTDRGNQDDEDIGSSASRGGGDSEAIADLDPTPEEPDVTGTTDVIEE